MIESYQFTWVSFLVILEDHAPLWPSQTVRIDDDNAASRGMNPNALRICEGFAVESERGIKYDTIAHARSYLFHGTLPILTDAIMSSLSKESSQKPRMERPGSLWLPGIIRL